MDGTVHVITLGHSLVTDLVASKTSILQAVGFVVSSYNTRRLPHLLSAGIIASLALYPRRHENPFEV